MIPYSLTFANHSKELKNDFLWSKVLHRGLKELLITYNAQGKRRDSPKPFLVLLIREQFLAPSPCCKHRDLEHAHQKPPWSHDSFSDI